MMTLSDEQIRDIAAEQAQVAQELTVEFWRYMSAETKHIRSDSTLTPEQRLEKLRQLKCDFDEIKAGAELQ